MPEEGRGRKELELGGGYVGKAMKKGTKEE